MTAPPPSLAPLRRQTVAARPSLTTPVVTQHKARDPLACRRSKGGGGLQVTPSPPANIAEQHIRDGGKERRTVGRGWLVPPQLTGLPLPPLALALPPKDRAQLGKGRGRASNDTKTGVQTHPAQPKDAAEHKAPVCISNWARSPATAGRHKGYSWPRTQTWLRRRRGAGNPHPPLTSGAPLAPHPLWYQERYSQP